MNFLLQSGRVELAYQALTCPCIFNVFIQLSQSEKTLLSGNSNYTHPKQNRNSKWQCQSVRSCTNLLEVFYRRFLRCLFLSLGHDLQGAIQYVIKRRRLSQLSLKIEVTIMLKFQGRQIKIRLIGQAQHAKEWKHCLLVLFNVQWINCLAFKGESAQIKTYPAGNRLNSARWTVLHLCRWL